MTNTEAFAIAQRKARYGRKTWLVWRNDDDWSAEPETRETLEAATRTLPTAGRFFATDGRNTYRITPALAELRLKNAA